MTVNIHRGISIALMITLITLQLSMAEMIVVHSYGETHSGIAYTVCDTLYFLNAIYIENSTLNTTLYMETPQNLSFNSFINQTVTTLYVKNLVFLNRSKHYAFQIKPNSTFYGFFLAKVVVCGPHRAMLLRTIKRIIHSKDYRDLIIEGKANETIPSEIKSKYILKPHRVVVEVLKPEFEKWVKYMFNVSVTNLSKFSLAVIAAYYIYGQFYITYTPSPFPRPIDYVIQKRQGDCDDMSRVLV
ncbi:MAG TPA: transglutaminase domain-containing protein, partial [Ignisphaera sp.]|nr:transglutaminase domain-containing protein [Ignisphaera sp.]